MKPLSYAVLKALAGGEFRSGESIARQAGMSRGSVWHAIRELEAAGLTVYKVRGRGYRLSEPISLLDAQAVRAALSIDADFFSIDVLDTVESTNTLLTQRAAAGEPQGSVVAAEWQTAGRGRMGRTWHAGIGSGLTFSLLWRFEQGAGWLGGLSLAAGVALMRVLQRYGVHDASVKWPNDILWHGCKLAGILIEMHGDALGPSAAVIGIGLNVRLPGSVRDRIDQAAADMETACGRPIERNALFADVLKELRAVLGAFARTGLAPLRDEWLRYHGYEGRAVTVKLADGRVDHGRVCGVAEDGALLLETPSGTKRFHSGEVTLRGDARTAAAPADRSARDETVRVTPSLRP